MYDYDYKKLDAWAKALRMKDMTEKPTLIRTVGNKTEAQVLANFLWNEKERHLDDVNVITSDLIALKRIWKVKPKGQREFVKVE